MLELSACRAFSENEKALFYTRQFFSLLRFFLRLTYWYRKQSIDVGAADEALTRSI
jgi:hypothetical protein